jgi:hypothetical protein
MEASLQRLESQTLARRNGDDFFFLTDEERELGRGIKSIDLLSGEEVKALGDLVFDEVLGGTRKFRFEDTKKDFGFNRFCDLHPHGTRTDGDLGVLVISPLSEDYADWNDPRCMMRSNEDGGQVIIKLPDDRPLGRELRTYLQTEKFVSRANDGTLPANTVKILRERADENRQRRNNLVVLVSEMLKNAQFFAAGQEVNPKRGSADTLIRESLDYLVRNTFTKLGYLKVITTDPQAEIRAVLTAPDTAAQVLDLNGEDGNAAALKDVLEYVRLSDTQNRRVILHDLIEGRFGKRPYGWPEWEVVLLMAKLVVAGEISVSMDGATLSREKFAEAVKTPNKWRSIIVNKRQTIDAALLQQSRNAAKNVFAKMGPDGEDALYGFLREHCSTWNTNLIGYLKLAETGTYPGKQVIEEGLLLLKRLLAETESYGFIKRFLELRKEFEDLSDRISDLDTFYTSQRPVWENLRKRLQEFSLNEKVLEHDAAAASALARMKAIIVHPEPYPLIKEIEGLISTVASVNTKLVEERRAHALARIDEHINEVKAALDHVGAPADLRNKCLHRLQAHRSTVEKQASIAHILQAVRDAVDDKDEALDFISRFVPPQSQPADDRPLDGETLVRKPQTKPQAVFKKPRVIKPAAIKGSGYLRSKADVEAFLSRLRAELDAALAADEPIDIR